MPKSVNYRANSIVYFQGDKAEEIPILHKGSLELKYEDLQSGAEIRELVQIGEFFGVKAALGHYFHDETALAVSDCTIVYFSVQEFEDIVSRNPRVLMKMLQVFSTQLRRIHNQVQGLLASDRVMTSQEAGLFAIGEHYFREKNYSRALGAFHAYLKHWPAGIYASQVTLKSEEAEVAQASAVSQVNNSRQSVDDGDGCKMSFQKARQHYELGHYKESMKGLVGIIKQEGDGDEEILQQANFILGYCFFHIKRYEDALRQLASSIMKYPDYSELANAVCFMGYSHEALGNPGKARSFLAKATGMLPENSSLYRDLVQKIRELGDDG